MYLQLQGKVRCLGKLFIGSSFFEIGGNPAYVMIAKSWLVIYNLLISKCDNVYGL